MERMVSAAPAAPTPKTAGASSPAVILKKLLAILLRNWFWFVLSLAVALGIAWYIVMRTTPVYQRTASIMIKQNEAEGMDKTLRDMGVAHTSVNIANELLLLRSIVVTEQVVRRLDLDVDCFEDGPFHATTLYGRALPVQVRFLDLSDREQASLVLTLREDRAVTLSNLTRNKALLDASPASLQLGDTVKTALGRVSVTPSPYYKEGTAKSIRVERTGIPATGERVRSRISATLREKNASIIDIKYRDYSRDRADDVLNTLMVVYNEQWMKNRNKQIVSTNDFIRERLAVIEQELGNVDQNISSFKSENLILDVQQAGAMAVAQAEETSRKSSELDARISHLRSVYDFMLGMTDNDQQIPLYSGIENGAILQRIAEYNSLVLRRNNHLAYTSAKNPIVVELDTQLEALRSSITGAISNEISTLQSQQSLTQSTRRRAVGKVAQNPKQANYLLSVERQQKVKESLYLYLLQKREENELSQAFTAYNTQIVEPPHGSWGPVEPVAGNIYLIALLIGLGLPALIIFAKIFLTTTVQGKEDLAQLQVPFAGVIPQAEGKKPRKGETPTVVVAPDCRDSINESFRVVRSNLEFLLGYDAAHKVVMLTSMDPGSGKTFIAANLSSVVALKGKKVLAIDLDLRRASLSAYVNKPHKGITGYLSGKYEDFHPLLMPLGPVDILPCGALPPNPTELLYTERFARLIEQVRQEYDYVFLDCPPVEIVADPAIAGRFADLTLFVVRAKLMEKSLLPEIDQWYVGKKFNNLVVLLNGTDEKEGRYGYRKYGYHYYSDAKA